MKSSPEYIPVKLADGIQWAVFRLDGPAVYAQFTLDESTGRKFDQYRLPLIWINGSPDVDLCLTKAWSELVQDVDLGAVPSFLFDDRDVSGVIWHGLMNEGTGVVGKLAKAEEVIVRIYFEDYVVEDYVVAGAALSHLKRDIGSRMLQT